MKSDMHTPTLFYVIWIFNVERFITQKLHCKEDIYTVMIGDMLPAEG